MITNTEITVYHKVFNQTTRLEEWVKYNYAHCWWFDSNGTVTNKGYENANVVDVRIPYDINPSLDVRDFSIGDIICKGHIDADAETILTEEKLDINLQQSYVTGEILHVGDRSKLEGITEHYNITMINDNTFGTQPHIHLGGK